MQFHHADRFSAPLNILSSAHSNSDFRRCFLQLTDAAELAQIVAILEELCPLVELHYPNLYGWCATYTLSVCLHAHQHQVTCLMLLRQVQRLCEASKEVTAFFTCFSTSF